MSTDISIFKSGLPSYLKGVELDETTKSLLQGGGGGGKRISIKGSVFRMIANGEEVAVNEDRSMNIIIVGAAPHVTRTFYMGTYKEGENAGPACWSDDGLTPSATSKDKQSSKCADCPQSIKGSGEGDARACRFSRRLAVVLDGDVGGDVYSLNLPATSIFGKAEGDKMPFDAYVRYLASHNLPVTAIVTEMRFDLKSPVPKLTFRPLRPLTEEEWIACQAKAQEQDTKDAIPVSFAVGKSDKDSSEGFETAKPVAKVAAKPVKEAPAKAKPAPVEAEPEAEPEPVKVTSKKAAAPVEADPDLASLIDEWAD